MMISEGTTETDVVSFPFNVVFFSVVNALDDIAKCSVKGGKVVHWFPKKPKSIVGSIVT